jgi:hypothetical protein
MPIKVKEQLVVRKDMDVDAYPFLLQAVSLL